MVSNVRRLRRRAGLAMAAAAVVFAGCTNDDVVAVSISIFGPGQANNISLPVGDTATLVASAYTGGYPSRVKYDSRADARRFHWTSSDTTVVRLSDVGFMETRAPGTAVLHAEAEHLTSPPMTVIVLAPATALGNTDSPRNP